MVFEPSYHLVMTNIAMERSTMLLIGKSSINTQFSMAMLVITRRYILRPFSPFFATIR